MRNPIFAARFYTHAYSHRAKQAITNTKERAVEHKSELTCIAATAVVVGLAARVSGFKAGYTFAVNA